MESTIHNRTTDRAGFFTFFWSVLLTTALSALVMWLCGGYAGYAFTRPGYLMPAAAVYVLDIAARLVFGFGAVDTYAVRRLITYCSVLRENGFERSAGGRQQQRRLERKL